MLHFTFKNGTNGSDKKVFRTPFTSIMTFASTDALESYLLNKHLFINGMYAGFVKKVTKVQKTSNFSEYRAVELTLTSDGVKEDKVTLPFLLTRVSKTL